MTVPCAPPWCFGCRSHRRDHCRGSAGESVCLEPSVRAFCAREGSPGRAGVPASSSRLWTGRRYGADGIRGLRPGGQKQRIPGRDSSSRPGMRLYIECDMVPVTGGLGPLANAEGVSPRLSVGPLGDADPQYVSAGFQLRRESSGPGIGIGLRDWSVVAREQLQHAPDPW